MKKMAFMCLLLLFSIGNASAELLIFKRLGDEIRVPKKEIQPTTVWLVDAPNIILGPINEAGSKILDEKEQSVFMESVEESIDKEKLQFLLVVSFAAKAKMKKYGLTELPSAIQIDRDGTVVRKFIGIAAIERGMGL